jgi:flagellar hook-associated protein 2
MSQSVTAQFAGMGAGFDTTAVVNGIMAAENVPLDQLKARQTKVDQAHTTLTDFASKVSSLQSALTALSEPANITTFTSTSSDAAVVSTVTGAGSPGAYSVTVTQIAREQRTYADGQPSSSAALGNTGSLDLSINGKATSIAVDPTDSLSGIAAKINASGARVSASIVFDGTSYRMQIRGKDTGAANSVGITESGFSLELTKPENQFQTADDAKLTVDGIPITRSTNQVVGVIPGVTLALTKPTTTPATVNVAADPSALVTKINAFVSAYTTVVSAGHFAAGFGKITASNPILAGDSAVRSTLDRLSRIVGSKVTGATGLHQSLASMGINSSSDGSLQVDTVKLNKAISDDPDGVGKVLCGTGSGTGAMGALSTGIDGLIKNPTSLLNAHADGFAKQSRKMTTDADAMQRRLDTYQSQLQAQFSALDAAMTKFHTQTAALGSLGK